ncbi:hypothetical protein PTI98_005722 [Pleurotus ostreatus]|nr:hypothetical protein PTI98_005722 [Pleurotus ostreatus]
MPKVMDVLCRMEDEFEMVPIFDSLLFRGSGVYVNPLTADPRSFRVISQRVVFNSGPNHTRPAVFVMPIVVDKSELLEPVPINAKNPAMGMHRRLTGWMLDEFFELFSTFVGSLLNLDTVYAYMTSGNLQFTSRPTKNELAEPVTPQKATRRSLAFGAPSPRAQRTKVGPTLSDLKSLHSLGPHDTIPVYDGHRGRGDFRHKDDQWKNLSDMPQYGVSPDNNEAAEVPPFDVDEFSVVLAAFTISTFNPKDNPTATQVSLNLLFSIFVGTWVSSTEPHEVSFKRISYLCKTAESEARLRAATVRAQVKAKAKARAR